MSRASEAGVDRQQMPGRGIVQYCAIGRRQRQVHMHCRSHDHTIGRILMRPIEIDGVRRDFWLERNQGKPRNLQNSPRPGCWRQRKPYASPACLQRYFPDAYRWEQQGAVLYLSIDRLAHLLTEPIIVLHHPDQDVRIEYDQRSASQSSGSQAGSPGSASKRYAAFFSMPMMLLGRDCCFRAGPSTATGFPRLVTVIGSPSCSSSRSSRVQFALNSAMPTILPIAASKLVTSYSHFMGRSQ